MTDKKKNNPQKNVLWSFTVNLKFTVNSTKKFVTVCSFLNEVHLENREIKRFQFVCFFCFFTFHKMSSNFLPHIPPQKKTKCQQQVMHLDKM